MRAYRCLLAVCPLMVTGCTKGDQLPLVFARTQTFGATVGASAPDQGAQITLGYGDRNLAVVPTTTPDGKPIRGMNRGTSDSLSVLGQFSAKARTAQPGSGSGISLGTFFATGTAATKLSDGFARQMGSVPKKKDDEEDQNKGKDADTGTDTGAGAATPAPAAAAAAPAPASATAKTPALPLIYARTQTFGATVGATAPDQGAQLTVGFGDRNIAIVPTLSRDGKPIRAKSPNTQDSLSVLGQFEANTQTSEVGLQTFFSTGMAASRLSEGFKALLGSHPIGKAGAPADAEDDDK